MIHYHGLPMTPAADMVKAFAGRHGMVSFEHPDQIENAAEVCQSIVLDNGAFSAWKSGKPHDFDGYMTWCRKWLRHPADDNDTLLREWPTVQAVPVYHLHESLDRLERLCARYDRVALGSSGKWSDPGSADWWDRMAEIMAVCCDDEGMPVVKLHGLRMLDPVIFSHLPLASADSCNVARNVGIDQAWNGPYAPRSRSMRALIMMERIEAHASASRWGPSMGVQHNLELLG